MTTTIHNWWKGNIYSIVTVLGDLAPGDSHPSYTECTPLTVCTVYAVLHDRIKQHGHICVVFGGYGRRSQCIRCRTLPPYHNIQSTSYRKHPQVSMSQYELQGNTANMVRFIALLASYLEYAGCEMHHASVGCDRLIVLTELGVADEDDAPVLVGCDNTSS